jgi:hypothetical protein
MLSFKKLKKIRFIALEMQTKVCIGKANHEVIEHCIASQSPNCE